MTMIRSVITSFTVELLSARPFPPNDTRSIDAQLNEHLSLTTQQARFRLQQNRGEDAATFDRIHDQAMAMADALSDGVIHHFPSRF